MASVLENRQVRRKEGALGEDQSGIVDVEVVGSGVHLEAEDMKYCDCIDQFNEKLKGTEHTSPFTEMYLIFTSPTATIFAIQVPQKTRGGNWSATKHTNIVMAYCPFCGQELPKPPQEKNNVGNND